MMKEVITTQFISHCLYHSGLTNFWLQNGKSLLTWLKSLWSCVRFKNSVLWDSHNPRNNSKSTTYSILYILIFFKVEIHKLKWRIHNTFFPLCLRIWQWITVGKLTVKELSHKTFSTVKKQAWVPLPSLIWLSLVLEKKSRS